MSDLQKTVDTLLDKAAKTDNAAMAMQFTQAALNAAHTRYALEPMQSPASLMAGKP